MGWSIFKAWSSEPWTSKSWCGVQVLLASGVCVWAYEMQLVGICDHVKEFLCMFVIVTPEPVPEALSSPKPGALACPPPYTPRPHFCPFLK